MAAGPNKMAWIASEETTYFVSLPGDSPRSPIRDLIERVYHAESLHPVSRARTILRERIHANFPAGIADRETVKVTAKRLSAPTDREPPTVANVAELPEAPSLPSFQIAGLAVGSEIGPAEIPVWLERLKAETKRGHDQWSSDRPVSAILVDEKNRVLAFARNTNAAIRTRHAEWNLCEGLGLEKIRTGAKLYVSLKPCRMCAARIWEAAEDPAALEVIYLENDPGPLAQGTMLESRSPARVRYLGVDHPYFAAEVSRLACRFTSG